MYFLCRNRQVKNVRAGTCAIINDSVKNKCFMEDFWWSPAEVQTFLISIFTCYHFVTARASLKLHADQSNNFFSTRAEVLMTHSSVSARGGCVTQAFIFLWRETQTLKSKKLSGRTRLKKKKKKPRKKNETKGHREREMRTFQSQSHPAQRGAPSSLRSLSSSAMNPISTASITLAALLILTIPVCKSELYLFYFSWFWYSLTS